MAMQAREMYREEQMTYRRQRVAQGSARKLAMVTPKDKHPERSVQTGRNGKYRRRKEKNDRMFYALVVVAVLMLLFYSRVKAIGQEDVAGDESLYYQDLVEGYTRTLRGELTENGYANSGITTTCIIDGQIRTYRIGIHHERINHLEEEEQAQLLDALENIPFDVAGVKTELHIIR